MPEPPQPAFATQSDPWPVETPFATAPDRTGFAFDAQAPRTDVADHDDDGRPPMLAVPAAPDGPPAASAVEPEPERPPVSVTEIPRPLLATGAELVVGASVDIGANSVHLLVAAAGDHQLDPLLDESVFLGLGDRVATDGYLGSTAREDLVAALASYADAARNLGAREIVLMGTEPIRRAADAAILVREVEARTGLPLYVLDHREEGMLTLAGVTMRAGRRPRDHGRRHRRRQLRDRRLLAGRTGPKHRPAARVSAPHAGSRPLGSADDGRDRRHGHGGATRRRRRPRRPPRGDDRGRRHRVQPAADPARDRVRQHPHQPPGDDRACDADRRRPAPTRRRATSSATRGPGSCRPEP